MLFLTYFSEELRFCNLVIFSCNTIPRVILLRNLSCFLVILTSAASSVDTHNTLGSLTNHFVPVNVFLPFSTVKNG